MKLQLSNFRTEVEPRVVEGLGNPLFTFNELRAGDGINGRRGGNGQGIAFMNDDDMWVWKEDGSLWTDIEVLEA
jgi:predicted glutamine amidotransferase